MNCNINRLFRRCFSRPGKAVLGEKAEPVKLNDQQAVTPVYKETRALQSIPESIQATRRCIIYRPSKSAMQSGTQQTHHIRLEFDKTTAKWESRVLGWTSSLDSVQGLVMQFPDVAAAEAFCRKQGLQYEVRDCDAHYEIEPKLYADNFRYSAGKLKLIRTK